MTEYTPEKVADLIAELRKGDGNGCKHANDVMRRAADALEVVSAEREADRVEHGRRWANVIKANVALVDRLSGAEAERDEALAVIAEALAYAKALDEWRAFDGRGKHLLAILSRIPEHPKED